LQVEVPICVNFEEVFDGSSTTNENADFSDGFEQKIENVDKECDEIIKELINITCTNELTNIEAEIILSGNGLLNTSSTYIESDEKPYDLTIGEIISDLVIRLGSDEIPRASCACHKANLAVRKSIQLC
jgi:hypothetical protein